MGRTVTQSVRQCGGRRGGGFIRPEVATLPAPPTYHLALQLPRTKLMGRNLPQIDERAGVGTDKSVPYKNLANLLSLLTLDFPTNESA
ncbi:MAG: hypothetical protein FWG87_14010 [Defluviitaleaceae bacterium]|nr:hypothetical protein [Defluviitaleaceae bacterium]